MARERLSPALEQKALHIARSGLHLKADERGENLFDHSIKVASYAKTRGERIISYLHRVVDNSDITLKHLYSTGFSKEIIRALSCLSRRSGESEQGQIQRIKRNPLATRIKLYDLLCETKPETVESIPEPARKSFLHAREVVQIQLLAPS